MAASTPGLADQFGPPNSGCAAPPVMSQVTWLPKAPPPRLNLSAKPESAPAAAPSESSTTDGGTPFVPTKAKMQWAAAPTLPPATDPSVNAQAHPSSASDASAHPPSTPAVPSAARPDAPEGGEPHGAKPTASTALSPDGVPPFPFLTLLVRREMIKRTAALCLMAPGAGFASPMLHTHTDPPAAVSACGRSREDITCSY